MIVYGDLNAKWNGNLLQLYAAETNQKMIQRLEDNLNTITMQNLALLETVSYKLVK